MSSSDKESEILKIIETLTTTGKRTLDEALMKKLKNICKSSDSHVNYAYYAVMTQLRKEHSEIRFSALQIINELFCRSSVFRKLLEVSLEEFFELVVETNPDSPLPLPLPAAKELKRKALEFIQNWCTKFGDKYTRLQLGFNYLKKCKKVDFNDLEARNATERERQRQEDERMARVVQEKILKVQTEMQELTNDMVSVTTQMENCFRLLIPHPDDFFSNLDFVPTSGEKASSQEDEEPSTKDGSETDVNEYEPAESDLRPHGLYNMKKSITVEMKNSSEVAVSASEDNLPVIENLHDLYRQVTATYLPTIAKWLKILAKGSNCSDTLKKAIDLKQLLESSLVKYKELKIKPCFPKTDDDDDDDDDDDFEEVKEKEGYEDKVKVAPVISHNSFMEPGCSKNISESDPTFYWKLKHVEDDAKDPTAASSTLKKRNYNLKRNATDLNDKSKSSKDEPKEAKPDVLEKAPILPYDIDLYHWEDENPEIPEKIRFDSLHKFWESKDDENEEASEALKEAQLASLRTRKIDFSGKFEPVKWSCRAPLPSGKLCPRKDRYKCPFHGKIIKRDNVGNPIEEEAKPQTTVPDWQDPALLNDIEAATGINLKIPEKRGKGKKQQRNKKGCGLTKIKNIPISARQRIEKKILKRYQHYAPKLDEMERKRFNDKFGDQWNYY
ncbi:UV-stimulated scaffold protein A-like [Uloborus diversus]|uniref:UV-stimulated scaffold protein A-like n=1 Tax=Uloborus diversus TaxID=327109 RepID=UPI00240925A1|nr:UV-stimulated scaffold protein A-like [Uloborus diversus]